MRSSKSRSRNNKNRNRPQAGGGNNPNRVFDSSGPEGKVRGTPQQIIDKYNQLARDAVLGSDRVAVENFQQHAEHYTRLLASAQREADVRREQQEAQNRERQVKRDSERTERNERQQRQEAPVSSADQQAQPQPQMDAPIDPANAPQPDMIQQSAADDASNGLVDTPESKPAPKKRTRKPKPAPKAEQTDAAE